MGFQQWCLCVASARVGCRIWAIGPANPLVFSKTERMRDVALSADGARGPRSAAWGLPPVYSAVAICNAVVASWRAHAAHHCMGHGRGIAPPLENTLCPPCNPPPNVVTVWFDPHRQACTAANTPRPLAHARPRSQKSGQNSGSTPTPVLRQGRACA